MVRVVVLILRRLGVLAVVVLLAYFTAFLLFPFLDRRFPALWAALVTYSLMAYAGIPMAVRILRFVYKPNHVPHFTATGDGWASDPVNIAVLAHSEKDFIWAMRKAGWHTADKNSLRNVAHEGYALLFKRPYPAAPFSKLYLFGRRQDLGFQIPVGGSPRHRHHVRFWRVDTRNNPEESRTANEHQGFWRALFRRFLRRKYSLWVGAAIYDSGPLAIRWRNGQITHQVHPDANSERDFIIDSLERVGVVRALTDIKAGAPYKGRGQALGVSIISDGFVRLCEIKHQMLPPADDSPAPKSRRRRKKR
jgi:hypothetical protein